MNIDGLLKLLIEKRGSDLHLKVGLKPILRMKGELEAQKMKEIGALFAEKCEFKADTISFSGLYNREDISSYAARARLPFIDLSLHFYDLDVSFPEKEVAKVTATAKLTGKLSTGECVDETHEFVSVLKKVEKRWLLTNLEVIEVLKK